MTETTRATTARPSHQIPKEIFSAILHLEDLVREADKIGPNGSDGQTYLKAVIRIGGARDDLARLILDAIEARS